MRYFIIILLCIGFKAEGQIIRAQPFITARQVASTNLLLDDYPNAAAAYSLRKLKTSYSGSAIRIRRDSTGNAETDIGFLASGELDTNAIKTHCRNNSCMVTTWYNQGDSASVDFTQTTAASQPRIMTTGTIERRSGKPSIRFDVSGTSDFMDVASSTVKFNYLHQAGQAAVFMTVQAGLVANPSVIYNILDNHRDGTPPDVGYHIIYRDDNATTANNMIETQVSNASALVATYSISVIQANNYFTPNVFRLISQLLDNSTATAADRNILYLNGANETKTNTSTNTASTANATRNMRLGRVATATSSPLNGFISEIILYPTDQTSNRTGIETNIINFYGL